MARRWKEISYHNSGRPDDADEFGNNYTVQVLGMRRRGNETGGCDGRRGEEDALQKGHKEAGRPRPRRERRARRTVVVGGAKAFLRLEVGSKMAAWPPVCCQIEIYKKATNNGSLVAESRGRSPTARPRRTRPTSVRGRTRARRASPSKRTAAATTAIMLVISARYQRDIGATAEVTLTPPPRTWTTG